MTGNQNRFAAVFVDLSDQLRSIVGVHLSDLHVKSVGEWLDSLFCVTVLRGENCANP